MPLRIRLIGLRVTNLKDLRAPEPAGGIKQVTNTRLSIRIHPLTRFDSFSSRPIKAKLSSRMRNPPTGNLQMSMNLLGRTRMKTRCQAFMNTTRMTCT